MRGVQYQICHRRRRLLANRPPPSLNAPSVPAWGIVASDWPRACLGHTRGVPAAGRTFRLTPRPLPFWVMLPSGRPSDWPILQVRRSHHAHILQAIPAGRLPWTPLPKISLKIAPSLDFSDESKNSSSPPPHTEDLGSCWCRFLLTDPRLHSTAASKPKQQHDVNLTTPQASPPP